MWQPALDRATLQRRATLLADIRRFFHDRQVMEVDVPTLGATTVTDPHLSAPSVQLVGRSVYLQTSPEFFMKRLLAAGSGSIYSLGKAVRDDESGRRHNPEFTLLEWYREGLDDRALMDEVFALFAQLSPGLQGRKVSYREVFSAAIGFDPHTASDHVLRSAVCDTTDIDADTLDRNACLELLFSYRVESELHGLTAVYDYPASQCALAKVREDETGVPVAKRFEVFWKGMELANGYWELTDAEEQRQRFLADCVLRQKMGRTVPKVDEKLLAALAAGLPECAGVALGVDRLLMCLFEKADIAETMPFPFSHL